MCMMTGGLLALVLVLRELRVLVAKSVLLLRTARVVLCVSVCMTESVYDQVCMSVCISGVSGQVCVSVSRVKSS